MADETVVERIHALQVSLKDGDDLAKAINLIGDALERRMDAIRTSLEQLKQDERVPDGDRLDQIVDRVTSTLDRYEDEIETRRRRMEELADEFQNSLGTRAEELDEFEAQLDDSEA